MAQLGHSEGKNPSNDIISGECAEGFGEGHFSRDIVARAFTDLGNPFAISDILIVQFRSLRRFTTRELEQPGQNNSGIQFGSFAGKPAVLKLFTTPTSAANFRGSLNERELFYFAFMDALGMAPKILAVVVDRGNVVGFLAEEVSGVFYKFTLNGPGLKWPQGLVQESRTLTEILRKMGIDPYDLQGFYRNNCFVIIDTGQWLPLGMGESYGQFGRADAPPFSVSHEQVEAAAQLLRQHAHR